jgi:hypothetical protein
MYFLTFFHTLEKETLSGKRNFQVVLILLEINYIKEVKN